MSNNNFFTIKAVVNKPGVLKHTPHNIPYAGLSVGIPKFNKQTNQTEYSNVYVKAWREAAEMLSLRDAKGMYRLTGEINSYVPTNGEGKSFPVMELVVQSVEKIQYIPKNQNQNPPQNNNATMPPGQPATVTPAPRNNNANGFPRPRPNQGYEPGYQDQSFPQDPGLPF